jgi:hypothetical protein
MDHRKKINQPVLAFLIYVVSLTNGQPAYSQIKDWTMVVSAQRQDQLLNYPGSPLAPIIKTAVECYRGDSHEHYEDLFYSHGHPIGLRQYNSLDLAAGTSGIIRIQNLGENTEESYAAANAAIRVYTDLFAMRAIVLYIAVPKDSFNNLIEGLEHYGFYKSELATPHFARVTAMLSVVSEPAGRSEEMLYAQ